MRMLVNLSNIASGGGVQAADSFCRTLNGYSDYFVVVYSSHLGATVEGIRRYRNVKLVAYDYPSGDIVGLILGRNQLLDALVDNERIDCVLTLFGPMKWRPRCRHVCGFAMAHIVMTESPYFKKMGRIDRWALRLRMEIWQSLFWRADALFTENAEISRRLSRFLPGKEIATITNCYNQIYDQPERWKPSRLPAFEGKTILYVGSAGCHKNVEIALVAAYELKKLMPQVRFRFVFTFDEAEFPTVPASMRHYFIFLGKVDVSECPRLYEQSDVVFQPSLLECFTAVFPEAMRMRRPIVTVDLPYARGLCKDAAAYYSPMSGKDAAYQLHNVLCDRDLQSTLVEKGTARLVAFHDYSQRSCLLMRLCCGGE